MSWVAAVRAASKSPALLATSAFALGGIGFALAQLLLAKALPPNEFAIISLVLAINQIGSSAGTLGIEVPINRHRIPATRALLARTLAFAAPIAVISGIIGVYGYGIAPIVGLLTCATIIASSANMVASALFRSTRQFVPGLLLTQLQNYALLAIAGIALIMLSPSAAALTAMIAIAYGAGASVGWMALLRRDSAAPQVPPSRVHITEGLFTLGFNIAAMIMVQFERLIIPRSLTMNDLAVFSVAAALAASPFRMLQIGVGYTLLPRLRACQNVAQIKMLLIKEAVLVAVSTVALIGLVLLITPQVLAVFLKGRYHLSDALLLAIFAVGTMRIVSAFAVSCVQALGHKKQFRQLTIWSWLSVAASLGGALACSRFGLEGIVYGVGAGWLLLTLVASLIASSLIRARDAASVN